MRPLGNLRPDRDSAELVLLAFPGERFSRLPCLQDEVDSLLCPWFGEVSRRVVCLVLVGRAAQEQHFHSTTAQRVPHRHFLGEAYRAVQRYTRAHQRTTNLSGALDLPLCTDPSFVPPLIV